MQNVVIPLSLEQRVSWKTTLDAIVLTAGMTNNFTIQLRDVVSDVTPGVISASYYRFYIRTFLHEDEFVLSSADDVAIPTEAKELVFSLKIPHKVKRGYYSFQLILEDADKEPIGSYETYAVVNSAIQPLHDNPYMSLESVRAQFADISFEDNKLLDSQEVGTWDICDAVHRAIQQWNNTGPRLTPYSGETFPYPEILRRGTIYMLIQSIWTMLERNRMQYAAGNAQVDLERRADAYAKLMATYKAEWSGGMNQAKNQENIEAFNRSVCYL